MPEEYITMKPHPFFLNILLIVIFSLSLLTPEDVSGASPEDISGVTPLGDPHGL